MKRFYKTVEIITDQDLFFLRLDGKHLRTPAKSILAVPSEPLAKALLKEWEIQKEHILPATMPFTRLVNSILDGVVLRRDDIVADIVRYVGSDLLCYRVETPENLMLEQHEKWDPVLLEFDKAFDMPFSVTSCLSYIKQPDDTLSKSRLLVEQYMSPFSLGALHGMTTLTGSAILALSLGGKLIEADQAWELAHLDEFYQEKLWGRDDEAVTRRTARYREFTAAAQVLAWEKY